MTAEVSAFQEFFERHQRGVFSLLLSLGLEETQAASLTQDVFVRIWREQLTLASDAERMVGLYRYALVWGRSAAPRRPARTSPACSEVERVRSALLQLPEEERVALILTRVSGLNLELVGRVLHDPERRVRHVLKQALAHVAALLLPFTGG